ncbi:Pre-rRNA-processing protein TSR2-domain-containing protein [Flagelloscypha sp. PMI_526]|nr:Pre-rRNA-processing protein TSR2-domain-containing protein [Flagelloscypha sp. PMI_526]
MSQPNTSTILFARGVMARLQTWSVMRAAIQEGWGGSKSISQSKSTWLASSIVDAFEEAPSTEIPDDQYIEQMLLQVMADEFDVVLEDGSSESVAVDICKMWDETRAGGDDSLLVRKFEKEAQKLEGKKMELVKGAVEEGKEDEEWVSSDEESDGEEEDDGEEEPELMQVDSPKLPQKLEPIIDEDGFTLVQKKGKR